MPTLILKLFGSKLVHKLNSYLPKDIVVYDIIPVPDEAHTRFDATKRTYEYHINTFKDLFFARKVGTFIKTGCQFDE
jgi:tRNA pseudouridine38-40 synthase